MRVPTISNIWYDDVFLRLLSYLGKQLFVLRAAAIIQKKKKKQNYGEIKTDNRQESLGLFPGKY